MAVLLLLGVGALYLFLKQLDPSFFRTIREKNTASTLAQAKDALIGYAATRDLTTTAGTLAGAQRPGELPCPDTDNDGSSNAPCNGNAIGRLPWRTLGLSDLRDSNGERLWYAVSTNFKNSTRTGILNSDTTGTITVRDSNGSILFDGSGTTGAVAVIIAPGAPLLRLDALQQDRAAANLNNPQHYLDNIAAEDNADFINGNTNGFFSGPVRNAAGQIVANDQVLVLTRDELMAAVDKRVAMEVRTCVENYATANGNQYPWPAPHANPATFNGIPNTFFGRIPSSIAGINPEAKLNETLTQVTTATIALAAAGTPEARATAAQTLATAESALRQFLYQIELSALSVSGAAANLKLSATDTKNAAVAAAGNPALLAPAAVVAADKALAHSSTLQSDLRNTGFDATVPELTVLIVNLQAKLDAFEAASTLANAIALRDAIRLTSNPEILTSFLYRLYSPNPTLSTYISVARGATDSAFNYATSAYLTFGDFNPANDITDIGNAVLFTRTAISANKNLIASIQAQRISVQAYDLAVQATRLFNSAVASGPAPYPDYGNWAAKLKAEAEAAKTLLLNLSTTLLPLGTYITNAYNTANAASIAADNVLNNLTNPSIAILVATASSAGNSAYLAMNTLASEVAAQASYLSATQLSAYANSLSGYGTSLNSPAEANALKVQANFILDKVNRITTAATSIVPPSTVSVVTARANAITALLAASTAAQAAFEAYSGTTRDAAKTAATAASTAVATLAITIANNGDNLSYTTLKYWAYDAAGPSFSLKYYRDKLNTPPPIAADATNMASTSDFYIYWIAQWIWRHVDAIYNSASALDSTSQSAINTAIVVAGTPSDANVAAAIAASNTLASNTGTLLSGLSSSTGEAVPAGWSGATGCAPNSLTGTFSWWDNGWQQHVFYQIGNISSSAAGTLTVNGSGTYRAVTVAHGRALTGQARPSAVVADYLEAGNADPTRNNGAPSPTPAFVQNAPGPQFNDRLGYQ